MKKKKSVYIKKVWKIPHGAYPAEIYLAANYSIEDFNKWAKRKLNLKKPVYTNSDACVHILEDEETHKEIFVLRLVKFDWTITHQSLLVHELFHLTMEICESIGMSYNNKHNSEAFAYYQQYLYGVCCEKLLTITK